MRQPSGKLVNFTCHGIWADLGPRARAQKNLIRFSSECWQLLQTRRYRRVNHVARLYVIVPPQMGHGRLDCAGTLRLIGTILPPPST